MTSENGILDLVNAILLAAEQDLKFSIVGRALSDWANVQCKHLSIERSIDITLTNWAETGVAYYSK